LVLFANSLANRTRSGRGLPQPGRERRAGKLARQHLAQGQFPGQDVGRDPGHVTDLTADLEPSIFWWASTACSSGSTSCTTKSSSPRLAAANCPVRTARRSGSGTVSVLKVANDGDCWNAANSRIPKSADLDALTSMLIGSFYGRYVTIAGIPDDWPDRVLSVIWPV
jgi:hypothetical protein